MSGGGCGLSRFDGRGGEGAFRRKEEGGRAPPSTQDSNCGMDHWDCSGATV